MSVRRAQLLRLLLVCAAWAAGETAILGIGLDLRGLELAVPAGLAVGVYLVTEDLGRARPSGGGKYWRGRRVDDDPPRRWN